MGAELTYQPEPPDLSEENFAFLSMIQSNSIPQSKLSIVIASYEKTLGKIVVSFSLTIGVVYKIYCCF